MSESRYIETLCEDDDDLITELLVGRRIVKAERNVVTVPSDSWDNSSADGRLTLDNGVEIYVQANDGCGGCTAGNFYLLDLATTDNIITDVRLHETDSDDDEYDTVYRIFVITENTVINVLEVAGGEDNGYYGTGYELFVFGPKA